MIKKTLLALCFIVSFSGASYSQTTASQTVIGYYANTGTNCKVGPCFVPYGSTVPTSGGGGGTSDTNITEVGGNAVTDSLPVSGTVTTTPSQGTEFSPAQITLAADASHLVLATGTFVSRRACNIDDTIVEYVGAIGVTPSTGLPVLPNTCIDVSGTTAPIYGVAASDFPVMSVVQY